ncbi:hypothetical protein Salat_2963400 [Sesamum alatum]|uniref:Uncharacterized protein n=1 Tax=Sesamum alatum TaxID=300844 RepID=A0AAE2C7P0_9LAMI|nr:hypothetical protein Salat_2963400 [Sesamum alatum]
MRIFRRRAFSSTTRNGAKKDMAFITDLHEWARYALVLVGSGLGTGPSSMPQMSSMNASEILDFEELQPHMRRLRERYLAFNRLFTMVGFTWLPISKNVKATTRFWQNALVTVPNARCYHWNGEAKYERLAIIFEPPMGENIDEGPTINPVGEPVDEEDNTARDEDEEEEDTEGEDRWRGRRDCRKRRMTRWWLLRSIENAPRLRV